MKNLDVQSIIDSLTQIDSKRQYWFVRTQSGNYYEEFVAKNFIAIGYNEIKLSDISKAKDGVELNAETLSEIIRKAYPDELRPRYIGNQLVDFAYNIKKGDIVLIPSESTGLVSIGEVAETPIFIGKQDSIIINSCPFNKRKRINWLKTNLIFDRLDPQLLHLKYSQRTVTHIDENTIKIIDRLITPIFIKDNDAHLSLDVKQVEPIKALELFETWLDIFNLVEDISENEGYKVKKDDFEIKINVQSPGTIEFISYSIIGIVLMSTILAALIGAEIDIDTKIIKFHIKTEGLIKRVTEYLNAKSDRNFREKLLEKVQKMKISSDELVRILEKVNTK